MEYRVFSNWIKLYLSVLTFSIVTTRKRSRGAANRLLYALRDFSLCRHTSRQSNNNRRREARKNAGLARFLRAVGVAELGFEPVVERETHEHFGQLTLTMLLDMYYRRRPAAFLRATRPLFVLPRFKAEQ